MSRCLRLLLLVGLLGSGATPAEELEDAEVSALRSGYEYGRYAEVLERASIRIDQGQLSEVRSLENFHKHKLYF